MKKYFKINELVCPHVLEAHGEYAWRFIDPRLQAVIAWLRETLDKPIIVNSPDRSLTQRGLRCNLCSLVRKKTNKKQLYMSAHVLGAAVDFDVEGWKAMEVRQWIIEHESALPYPIRLEMSVSWVHLDVLSDGMEKVTLFVT